MWKRDFSTDRGAKPVRESGKRRPLAEKHRGRYKYPHAADDVRLRILYNLERNQHFLGSDEYDSLLIRQ
jgi:hypothetical protein